MSLPSDTIHQPHPMPPHLQPRAPACTVEDCRVCANAHLLLAVVQYLHAWGRRYFGHIWMQGLGRHAIDAVGKVLGTADSWALTPDADRKQTHPLRP